MLSRITSCGILGINGYMVDVEADMARGLPSFDIVGLPDAAVKESKERVRSAIKNSGFDMPVKKITVNLAPADIKKEGAAYDLPIAVGILYASSQIDGMNTDDYMFVGELSLGGEIRRVNGVLPMVDFARKKGIRNVVVPADNAREAAVAKGVSNSDTLQLIKIIPFMDMWLPVALTFGGAGILIGVGGSLSAIRKFLEV